MTKKSMSLCRGRLGTAAVAAAALFAASAANAQCGSCRADYEPGLLAFLTKAFTASSSTECPGCAPASHGDYRVKQGPTYAGPAAIAPQPTYSPTPTAAGYPYVGSDVAPGQEVELAPPRLYPREPVRRIVKRPPPTRMAKVEVQTTKKGALQIIRAKAEVRIYGPERMDIRLYRAKK